MKKLQNKLWAKCLAFLLCLASSLGALVSCVLLYFVGIESNKSLVLQDCYEKILTNYAYEIFDEIQTDNEAWRSSLEKYNEKNWSFALMAVNKEDAADIDMENPNWYRYISTGDLQDQYEYVWEEKSYFSFVYNTSSLLAMLYSSPWVEGQSYSIDSEIYYYAIDQSTGVIYAYTGTEFVALNIVCIRTVEGEKMESLNLQTEGEGAPYYILESTGERPTIYQMQHYDYIGGMRGYPLSWSTDSYTESMVYDPNSIYMASPDMIQGRVYSSSTRVYRTNDWEGGFISYSNEPTDYQIYRLYLNINEDLLYDDEIAQITNMVNTIYVLADAYVFIAFGCLLVFGAALCFLLYGAGHKKGQEEITLSVIDRAPFEIITAVAVGIFTGLICLFILLIESEFGIGNVAFFFLTGVLFEAAIMLVIFYLISIAARVKAKRFLKNTIIYFLVQKCAWIFKFLGKNSSLFAKCLLVMAGIGVGECICLAFWWNFCGWDIGGLFIDVCIWTVLEAVLVAFFCYQMKILQDGIEKVAEGDLHQKIDTSKLFWEFKKHGEQINKAGEGIAAAVEKQMKSERFRTELITNVSHDIKPPLTSIISYVDLIQKEDIQNENLLAYIEVLERQSNRLKKLIEDLMEASKASTGNLPVQIEDCDVSVLLTQLVGEYQEKLINRNLNLVVQSPMEPVMIKADGRYLWRVFDNLMNNICKYALEGTRVYLTMEKDTFARITFRNISRQQLNISSEELMERFVRGDSSRNTEGSGLGLSIAQSLTDLMNGKMELLVDGDLFKVILTFPIISHNNFLEGQNSPQEIPLLSQPEIIDEPNNKKD